ncbi:DUF2334 domain-containing protein [Clostridium sporogenes]|uniref:DUF2334 domain-containing protein n=2 Tax=Clostridium TaxID=1485 RepID=A0A6M0T4B5_CLOBO|nr:DUF2334 domain-containing protein [Clostridium sporogenes]NFA62294.1 DUF2334 domain-containing protein [Clostridium botulinum]MDS1002678.1 DUF2334 domain-containing protein [Clostridium sporogenes]NFI72349.1 DUF2334 domain-containing protein [Clostridium sporogenes]NFL72904.1 DUF2334 domain-containing protein [Clostridium sporogenes]NFM25238.1 DUF2334 domain-containing protein [Clostridium sporogenes]
MYKKIVISLMVCFLLIISANCKVKGIDNIQKGKVLIVHDNFNSFSYDNNIIYSVKELLGAFNTEVKVMNLDNYKEKEIYNYDYVFVIGIDEEINKKSFFIEDLRNYNKKICWIGKGIDIFLQNNPKYNMRYIGTKWDITETYYSNKKNMNISNMEEFYLDSNKGFTVLKPYSKDTKIYAYLSNGKDYFPYIINEKNLWHVSQIDNSSVIFYIFSDVLNDIFKVDKFREEKVFIRIEDVNPLMDINKLKSIADFLYSEDIPFMISLVPAVIDTKTGYTTGISDKKEFIETIKYMQKKGGAVILYGYTNQNSKKEVIKEGYKFENEKESTPLNFDMEKYVYDKVGKNLDECVKNQIYPLAFGAPHYDMDIREYKEFKKYFSTYVEQYQNNDKRFISKAYPYILKDTETFNILIPENLGNMAKNNSLWLREIQENFRKISIVRGYTAGVFFNPYMDINYLKNLVDYFKSQNVNFLDLKEEENWVKWNDIKVSSKNGTFNVKYKEKKEFNKKGFKEKQLIDRINFIIIIIVAVFITIFIIIFFLSKKKDRNKFLR